MKGEGSFRGQGRSMPTELVERLSAATVGSRELDAEIADAFDPVPDQHDGFAGRWPFVEGSPFCQQTPPVTTSLDAALALAERVHDRATALALLLSVIDVVGENEWPSSRIPTLYCAAILQAKEAGQ